MSPQRSQRPILVVEDNEDDVFLLRRGFEKASLHPVLEVVSDGQQAMDYLAARNQERPKEWLPFFVLLDLQLPYFTGFQILEWIRQQPGLSSLPVIVLTSSSSRADIDRAYAAGANSYLVKPSDVDRQVQLAQAISLFWLEFNQYPSPPPSGG